MSTPKGTNSNFKFPLLNGHPAQGFEYKYVWSILGSSSQFEHLTQTQIHEFNVIQNPNFLIPFVNSDLMDFNSLTRKELQSLCKLNKIPANITNVAMKEALQSLDIVQGIEKFISVSQSESVVLDESKDNVEVSSPKVPTTRCRTTTRRGTTKKLAGVFEEPKNDVLETPALSSTRRKAPATSSRRNVNSQLDDCEQDAKDAQKSPAPVVTKSRRKVAATSTTVKKESNVQKTYATRRSTRQTENKSGEPKVGKESEKAVKINSMLVIDISDDEEDSGEVHNLKVESDEILNPQEEGVIEEELNDVKPEPDGIKSTCENGDLVDEKLESEVMDFDECEDSIIDDNAHIESDAISCNTVELIGSTESVEEGIEEVSDEITAIDNLSPIIEETEVIESEVFSEKADDDFEDSSIEEKKQISPNPSTLFDLIGHPSVTPTRKSFSKNDVVKTPAVSSSGKKAPATLSSRKVDNSQLNEKKESETAVMIDLMVNEVTNVTPEEVLPVDVFESTMSAGNTDEKLEEKEDDVGFDNLKPESDDTAFEDLDSEEKIDAVDVIVQEKQSDGVVYESADVESGSSDDVNNVTCEEILPVEVPENTMDAGNPDTKLEEEKEDNGGFDNLKMETEEISKPETDDVIICPTENLDFEEEKLELSEKINDDDETMDVEDVKPEVVFTENADVDSFEEKHQITDDDETMDVEDVKPEVVFTENTDVDSFEEKHQITDDDETMDVEDVKPEVVFTENTDVDSFEEKHQITDDDETMDVEDVKPEDVITENADVDCVEEKTQISQNTSILIDDVISGPTPMKKMSSGVVSDDKENSAIVFVKKQTTNKEKDDDVIRSLQGKSLRQLKKQVKEALTLKTIKEGGNGTTRPALQALCENQMVGGETMN
ncbi:hypothetical protein L2E82_10622 [Cichorium intybus]|uniref:Uncharacterized protein n=1 Tax=Cichorium intybus TaxID=13427 RepID=A0ACB9GAZ4_CICIN|nr:hypothetical protein L2E82_10622 [Cichorium intybus]